MQSIKLRLYEADDDQALVVMARLNEANQRSLQSFSNPEHWRRSVRSSQQDPHKVQGNPNEKSHYLEHATGRKCSRCSQDGHNSRTCNCANI
ncbi:hypothetical protein BASA61_005461 [Batrachochytrium salamandrivorans]|nr:hypothetical protein BASA61_005461 [Batrachochytrium salamandrivorans]